MKKNNFYEKCDANKIKNQKEIEILLYQYFSTLFILHLNILLLPQAREWFGKILLNIKIYNLKDSKSLKKE